MVFFVMVVLLVYTIERSFEIDMKQSGVYDKFEAFYILILYLDVMLSLNTLYYKDGVQIKDRKKIFIHYIKNKFIADMLACLCMSIRYFQKIETNWIVLEPFMIFKLMKYNEFESRIKSTLLKSVETESIYKIIILILKIFLAAHFLACIWHYIAYRSSSLNPDINNWLKENNLIDEPWVGRYLYSIYWGVTTMLTVGYGDITPTNKIEVVFNIWAMLFGCGLFGYSMNYIGDVLKIANQKEMRLK